MNNFVNRWRLQSAALFANHAHATNFLTKLRMSFLQISFDTKIIEKIRFFTIITSNYGYVEMLNSLRHLFNNFKKNNGINYSWDENETIIELKPSPRISGSVEPKHCQKNLRAQRHIGKIFIYIYMIILIYN